MIFHWSLTKLQKQTNQFKFIDSCRVLSSQQSAGNLSEEWNHEKGGEQQFENGNLMGSLGCCK